MSKQNKVKFNDHLSAGMAAVKSFSNLQIPCMQMNLTVTGKYLNLLWTLWYFIFWTVASTFNQEKRHIKKHLKWDVWGVWQTWTLPLQKLGKVHLSKKKKGWLQSRLQCPTWPSLLLVLLGLGDLETETNTTCFYCWDQVLSLQVKASLVLLLWWDLPLWDKTRVWLRELKTGTPRIGIS